MNKKMKNAVTSLVAVAFLLSVLACNSVDNLLKSGGDNTEDLPIGGGCSYADKEVTIVVKEIKFFYGDAEMLTIFYLLTSDPDKEKYGGGGSIGVTTVEAEAKGVKVGKKFKALIPEIVSGSSVPYPIDPKFEDWK